MKPILYNTPMVQAILENRKTATRRIVKPVHLKVLDCQYHKDHPEVPEKQLIERLCSPPYKPGDVLYVRETWNYGGPLDDNDQPVNLQYYYAADGDPFDRWMNDDGTIHEGMKWRPSIHMPKEAARIFLRVTDVRAERLWESFGDGYGQAERFQQEGITLPEECVTCIEAYGCPCCSDLDDRLPYDEQTGEDSEGGSECGMLDEVRNDFALLWESTVKPADLDRYGWAANPWVWVIEFERCEKPKEEAQP